MKYIKTYERYTEDFYDIHRNMTYEILNDIKNGKKIKFALIPKNQYKKALSEFVKYGDFFRFPTKLIFKWKDLILINIAKLCVLTDIHGHSSSFPYDEFYDIFDYPVEEIENKQQLKLFAQEEMGVKLQKPGEYSKWIEDNNIKTSYGSWDDIYEFLDKVYHIDDVTPQFSNGHYVLSDYATEPLFNLGLKLNKQENPKKIIVTINKVLDVVHQRSDIAEIFIEGGSKTLSEISN